MAKDPKDKGLIKKLKDRVSQSGKKSQNNYPSPSKKDEPHGSRTRPPEDPKKRPSTYPMPTRDEEKKLKDRPNINVGPPKIGDKIRGQQEKQRPGSYPAPMPTRGQEKKKRPILPTTKPNPNIGPKEEPRRPMLPTKPYPDSEKPNRYPAPKTPNRGQEEPKRPLLPTKPYPDTLGPNDKPKKPNYNEQYKRPGSYPAPTPTQGQSKPEKEYSTYSKGNGTGKDDGKSSVGARRKPDKPKSPTSAAKKK